MDGDSYSFDLLRLKMGWKLTKSKSPKVGVWVLVFCEHWLDTFNEENRSPTIAMRWKDAVSGEVKWLSEDWSEWEITPDWWHFIPRLPPFDQIKEKLHERKLTRLHGDREQKTKSL